MKRCRGETCPTGVRLLLLTLLSFLLTIVKVKAEFEEEHWVRRLLAPSIVDPRDESVVLWCDYDLQGKELYSVNWYKNSKMLYRFMPSQTPKGTSFPVDSDVKVSLNRSNSTHLVLRGHGNLKKNKAGYEGTYFCEVSTEQPFLTDFAEANITAVIRPDKNPAIEGLASNYHIGEQLNATCTSAPSLPASNLTFYLNNDKIKREKMRLVTVENGDGTITTKLSLTMQVDQDHFPRGSLKLSCRATMLNVRLERDYKSEKNVALAAQKLAQELPSIFRSSTGSIQAFNLFMLVGIVILL